MLYTVLPRSAKYKAKNFIDTFAYRFGDQIGAWSYVGLGALGFGAATISLVAVPLAATWMVIGLWLGRPNKRWLQSRKLPEHIRAERDRAGKARYQPPPLEVQPIEVEVAEVERLRRGGETIDEGLA